MKKSPIVVVRENFGSKEKLVDKILGIIELSGESPGSAKDRLMRVQSQKLLRLLSHATEVKERFGDKKALVKELQKLMGTERSQKFVDQMLNLTYAQLLDLHKHWTRQKKNDADSATQPIELKNASRKFRQSVAVNHKAKRKISGTA